MFSELLWLLHTFDDLLCSISVMHIKVNNSNFLDLLAIGAHDIRGGDSHVVDIAKAIGLLLIALVVFESFSEYASVMARRPYSTESIFELLRHDLVTCLDDSST